MSMSDQITNNGLFQLRKRLDHAKKVVDKLKQHVFIMSKNYNELDEYSIVWYSDNNKKYLEYVNKIRSGAESKLSVIADSIKEYLENDLTEEGLNKLTKVLLETVVDSDYLHDIKMYHSLDIGHPIWLDNYYIQANGGTAYNEIYEDIRNRNKLNQDKSENNVNRAVIIQALGNTRTLKNADEIINEFKERFRYHLGLKQLLHNYTSKDINFIAKYLSLGLPINSIRENSRSDLENMAYIDSQEDKATFIFSRPKIAKALLRIDESNPILNNRNDLLVNYDITYSQGNMSSVIGNMVLKAKATIDSEWEGFKSQSIELKESYEQNVNLNIVYTDKSAYVVLDKHLVNISGMMTEPILNMKCQKKGKTLAEVAVDALLGGE